MIKNLPAVQEPQEIWVWSFGWEGSLEEGMATHSSILARESHGQRSLAGYSPWDYKQLDTTWWLSNNSKSLRQAYWQQTHFSFQHLRPVTTPPFCFQLFRWEISHYLTMFSYRLSRFSLWHWVSILDRSWVSLSLSHLESTGILDPVCG